MGFAIYWTRIHESGTRGYSSTCRFSVRIRVRSSQVITHEYLQVPVQVPVGIHMHQSSEPRVELANVN
jgi:hypothetical protein